MKRILSTLTIALAMSVPALAQAGGPADMADGEVRKVDKDEAKVTLRHGEIRSLDMPPMTMVFTAKDKALLDKVKAGDKVKFKAANEGGKLIVTDIDVAQ
ncbi:copper-binding protein [Azohydromonas lata]|uniref:copper-binding protein n=1 Tax=Azohydromonas lata TaxID=45677 RepID=UPI000831E71C